MKPNNLPNKKQSAASVQRHLARCCAVQILYQHEFNQLEPEHLIQEYLDYYSESEMDYPYLCELVQGVLAECTTLDALIAPWIKTKREDLDPVEQAVLRMAVFELKNRLDIPYRVVMNEAIEITKAFGATEGHRFINAVLDRLVLELRALEVQAKKK